MCNKCHKTHTLIEIRLKDKKQTQVYCPNCLAIDVINNNLKLTEDDTLICDVTGKNGAVMFLAYNEEYTLNVETMLRLIAHNLKPNEHEILINKYGWNSYMLHDDFYTEDHEAIQPM